MSRRVEVSRVLTIRGEELDCIVYCDVALFDDETGRGAEIDITKVEVDAADGPEIAQEAWPENLLDMVSGAAVESAAEQDMDDYDDRSRAED